LNSVLILNSKILIISKCESREIIDLLLKQREQQSKIKYKFDHDLIESILAQMEGFVFKDIEKLIDIILFNNYITNTSQINERTITFKVNLNLKFLRLKGAKSKNFRILI
jgi:hypothetical protein